MGTTTLQVSGLCDHAKSKTHNCFLQLLDRKSKKRNIPISKHVELMVDIEKERIILVIKNTYFVAIHDLSLEMYKSMCDLNRYNFTPHVLLTYEYSAYTNTALRKEFLPIAKELYWSKLKEDILQSPFY